jgi:hypothetical protein
MPFVRGKDGWRKEGAIMKTTICENCAYYDERKDEQPCCTCVEGCNFEEGGEQK